MKRIRIIRQAIVLDCGSYELRIPDNISTLMTWLAAECAPSWSKAPRPKKRQDPRAGRAG